MKPWWTFTRTDIAWWTVFLVIWYAVLGWPETIWGWLFVAPSILLGRWISHLIVTRMGAGRGAA